MTKEEARAVFLANAKLDGRELQEALDRPQHGASEYWKWASLQNSELTRVSDADLVAAFANFERHVRCYWAMTILAQDTP